MFSLQQLRSFIFCAEQGSFSAAARKLGKAQSVTSQTISNLEIDLGLQLFERSSRSPKLTHFGEILLTHAKTVVEQSEEMELVAKGLSKGEETELRIVIDSALINLEFMNLVVELSSQFQATQFTFNIATSQQIPTLIKENKANIGFMLLKQNLLTGVDVGFIGHIGFLTVASINHPLSKLHKIERKDLIFYPQLIIDSEISSKVSYSPYISPKLIKSNDFQTLIKMAESNLGWGYLPEHLVETNIKQGKLCQLPLSFDLKTWQVPIDVVTQKGCIKGPALTWLMTNVEKIYQ